jgi:hypothetical protein
MAESGLRINRNPRTAEERTSFAGTIRGDETVLAVGHAGAQAVVCSTGAPMSVMPKALQRKVWTDMLEQALDDLDAATNRASWGDV